MLNPIKLLCICLSNKLVDKYDYSVLKNKLNKLNEQKAALMRNPLEYADKGILPVCDELCAVIKDIKRTETNLRYAAYIAKHNWDRYDFNCIRAITFMILGIIAALAILMPLINYDVTHPKTHATWIDPDSGATYIKLGDTWVPKFDSNGEIIISEIPTED